MNSLISRAALVIFGLAAVPGTWAQSATTAQPTAACIAIMSPTVEGVPGSAADASKGMSDLMASYLQGPSAKAIILEAKLPSMAAEEAKQKGCEPLLITSVHRKSGGGRGLMKALGQAAGTASWDLPYGGSAAAGVARAGTSAGLQTVSSLAQSTKAKDEISFEYRLQTAGGQTLLGPKTENQKARADDEDLLTPVVTRAAEDIVAATAAKSSPAPAEETKQH